MRCETCKGRGRLSYDEHPEPKPDGFGSIFPCPVCQGTGQETPDDDFREPPLEEDGGLSQDEQLAIATALFITCII